MHCSHFSGSVLSAVMAYYWLALISHYSSMPEDKSQWCIPSDNNIDVD